ncbi:MAG: hypothetical protein EOO90_11360 [Pedobacter sp.]|nr:MAG: hypothetical protein EOO90_11360 [Pedobacter sp.]
MKNLLTIVFAFITINASAQIYTASNKTRSNNTICAERGHNFSYTKSTAFRPPYTIDTKDSTVTVYPAPHAVTGRCSRCGAEIDNHEKEVRITTWKRSDKDIEAAAASGANKINWGRNTQREYNSVVKSSNLDDIKKVATLRNDTLFIHKRIAPFASIKEQIPAEKYITVYYKTKAIDFKTAVFDEADFFGGKHGHQIY